MKRMLTGLQPSGELTIGSLIGGISQSVEYQNEYESFIFVPDMHAITVPKDPKELHERIRRNVALYIACGIDPKKNTIYIQSENFYHANLAWVLECNTYMGEASRMTQYKEKSQNMKNIPVGLFTYPILMAADILLYDADYVPVGIDQKQHVELARNIAARFNNKYGDTFKIPEPMISKTNAKIMDLQNPTKKMSKSSTNPKGIIYLLDTEEEIRKKVASATTDSDNQVKYDPEKKPGISNLLTIYAYFKKISIEETEEHFVNYSYKDFKTEVADTIIEGLTPIKKRYEELINSKELDKILDEGKEKVMKIAEQKLKEVYKLVGLFR